MACSTNCPGRDDKDPEKKEAQRVANLKAVHEHRERRCARVRVRVRS